MLKRIGIVLVLLMMFALPAIATEYVEGAYGVYVDEMEMITGEDGTRSIVFRLPNLSSQPISAMVIDLVMLDDDNQPVLGQPNDMTGFMNEIFVSNVTYPLTFTNPLEPNTAGKYTFAIMPGYEKATKARAAVSYFKRANGEEIYVSPEVMLWNNTDGTKREPAPGGKYYPGLTAEEKELAYSFPLGINTSYTPLSEEMAPYYNKSRGGFWVLSVKEDSLAAQLGLLAGDLLVTVDGVNLAEDLRGIELGKIKMAKGETISFTWLRGDEMMEGTLKKD